MPDNREFARLALPSRGRLADGALAFLGAAGLDVLKPNPRQFEATIPAIPNLSVLFQRAGDIAVSVRDGSVDFGITGWDTCAQELLKVGERCNNMTRAFNIREGKGKGDDYLPNRFFSPFTSGPLAGVGFDKEEVDQAIATYYNMVGWDENGVPTLAKLQELDIEWVPGVQ